MKAPQLITTGVASLRLSLFTCLLAVALPVSAEDACQTQSAPAHKRSTPESLRALWGIEVTGLRMSANGYMVDFRYRVLDPDKAATIGSSESRPLLTDDATGARLRVPRTPKVGPLRQTAEKPTPGKVYWMVFANPGKIVKEGSSVSISVGDFRADHLIIERTESLAPGGQAIPTAQVRPSRNTETVQVTNQQNGAETPPRWNP